MEWNGHSLITIPFLPIRIPNKGLNRISLKDPFYSIPFYFRDKQKLYMPIAPTKVEGDGLDSCYL